MAADPKLSAAIERHKAASAAVEAFDCRTADVPTELVDAETAALKELALIPCSDDAQFFQKVRYMVSVQKSAYGPAWAGSCATEILAAVDLHLSRGKRAGEGEKCAHSEAAENPEELEELDIAEKLRRPEGRLILLGLAIDGVALPEETIGALVDLIFDVRSDLEQLAHDLEQQDKAKRARGEPRQARIFLDGGRR
jgi:hypothetical protein